MERIFKFINQALYFVSIVLLLLEVVIVAGVAFCRYILHYTPAWGESLALLLGVWFCFLASAYAIPNDVHLKMTLIDNMVSEKFVMVLEWFGLAMTTSRSNNTILTKYNAWLINLKIRSIYNLLYCID